MTRTLRRIMEEIQWVSVRNIFAQCAYPMRPNAIALSNCCRAKATSAVQTPDQSLLYRCDEHRGQVSEGVIGEVFEVVPHKESWH